MNVQPAEFAKITCALMVANVLSVEENMGRLNIKAFIKAFIVIGIPMVLILLQPDLGSVLVFTALIFALFREGLSILFFLLPAFQHLPKHQKERIMVLFEGEEKYSETAGYNLLLSKMAIGSGEFSGRGYNSGPITDGGFVPEQHTDYIFSAVGEEFGFMGTSLLIILYMGLILRIYYLANGQRTIFARYYGNAVASILLLHVAMNIGMVSGIFPTVGIPLPFFSYGGSSLWSFSILIFIFLKLNYHDKQSI
ncbi:unnamed protein product, partial [Cyprideis torosa]